MNALQPLEPAPPVVVAEDDDVLRLLTVEVVLDLGLPAVAFATGDEAWAYLAAGGRVSMLVTDHSMPGQLSGNELARQVVQQRPGLPVILTSGYGYAAELGVPGVSFLPKPWSIDSLATLIKALLPGTT